MSELWFGEQYSPEWWDRRRGKPSASQFHRIIQPVSGKLSKQYQGYLCELVCERLLGHTFVGNNSGVEKPKGPWLLHGRLVEDEAIERFQTNTSFVLRKVGLVTTGDGRLVSSPDAFCRDMPAALEVKCPSPVTMVEYIEYGHGTDYRPQVQGHILVGEGRWAEVHFFAYHPSTPVYHTVTTPDGVYLEAMYEALDMFCDELDEKTEHARSKGVWDWLGEICRNSPEGSDVGQIISQRR
jgi:hypothetical protein